MRLEFRDNVLLVACVFSKRKLMHVVKDLILEDCAVLKVWFFLLGKRLIIHKEQRKDIGAWRAERKA